VVILDVTAQPFRVVHLLDVGQRDYVLQVDMVHALAERYNAALIVMDTTGHEMLAEELERTGAWVQGFRFTQGLKHEIVNSLLIEMEGGNVRLPPHAGLLTELRNYRFEITGAGNLRYGAPNRAGYFDDWTTALAMAVHHARSGIGQDEFAGWEPEYDELLKQRDRDPNFAVTELHPIGGAPGPGWSFRDIARYRGLNLFPGDDPYGLGY
jgi:hypothetical protein